MAKLPDETALGALPSGNSGRVISMPDASGYMRAANAQIEGAQALGRGIAALGAGIQSGINRANAQAKADAAKNDEMELARIKAEWNVQSTERLSALNGDNGYEDMAERTGKDLTAIRDSIVGGASFSDQRKATLFQYGTEDDIARGRAAASGHAFKVGADKKLAEHENLEERTIIAIVNEPDEERRAGMIRDFRDATAILAEKKYESFTANQKRDERFRINYGFMLGQKRAKDGSPDEVLSDIEQAEFNRTLLPKPEPMVPGPQSRFAPQGGDFAPPDPNNRSLPVALRTNNPSNQWMGSSARLFGATRSANVSESDQPAVFPDKVTGAAAMFHLLGSGGYAGKTVEQAIYKWAAGTNPAYPSFVEKTSGVSRNTVITRDFLQTTEGIAVAKAMARYEAGYQRGDYPLSDVGWQTAQRIAFNPVERANYLAGNRELRGAEPQVPVKVASADTGLVPGAETKVAAPTGSTLPDEPNVQVAQAGGPQRAFRETPYDILPEDRLQELKQNVLTVKRQREMEAATIQTKQSVEAREEYDRAILDAQAGRAALPPREAIERDARLSPTDRNTALRQHLQAEPEIASFSNAFRRLTNNEPFNPFDKEDRKNADRLFLNLGGNDAALTSIANRTNILPQSAASKMRADLISNDTKRVLGAMTRASNLVAGNSNIMAGVDGGEELEKQAVKFRTYVDDFGMTASEAANRIVREQTPEYKASVNAKIKSEDVDEKIRKNLKISDLANVFDVGRGPFGLIGDNPEVGFSPRTRDVMFDQYAERVKEHYLDGSDWDTSKKLAGFDLKKTWGVSAVNGTKTVMPYAPELAPVYRGIDRAADGIATQAMEAIKEATGEDVNRKSLRFGIIPGVTAQDYKAGRPPRYIIAWEDKNGLLQTLNPGKAFVADPQRMRQMQWDEREAKSNEAREVEKTKRMIGADPRMPFGVPTGVQ